ncbi:hypothetical protein [Leeia oryzae]|nr:hypothetical protein [Leeia oryzae]
MVGGTRTRPGTGTIHNKRAALVACQADAASSGRVRQLENIL